MRLFIMLLFSFCFFLFKNGDDCMLYEICLSNKSILAFNIFPIQILNEDTHWSNLLNTVKKSLNENYSSNWKPSNQWEIHNFFAGILPWDIQTILFNINAMTKQWIKLVVEHIYGDSNCFYCCTDVRRFCIHTAVCRWYDCSVCVALCDLFDHTSACRGSIRNPQPCFCFSSFSPILSPLNGILQIILYTLHTCVAWSVQMFVWQQLIQLVVDSTDPKCFVRSNWPALDSRLQSFGLVPKWVPSVLAKNFCIGSIRFVLLVYRQCNRRYIFFAVVSSVLPYYELCK